MKERGGGAIVNVGSMWASTRSPATPTSAYSAARASRHALTKNLALELAPENIRINTVALAFVETPAYERFLSHEEAQDVLDAVAPVPSAQPARPAVRRHGGDLFLAGFGAGWILARRCRSTARCSRATSPAVHAEVEAVA